MGHAVMFDLGHICLRKKCVNISDMPLVEVAPFNGAKKGIVVINLDYGLLLIP